MFRLHNPKSKQNIYNSSKLHTMVKLCNPFGHLQEKNLECVLVAARVILKKYLGRVQPNLYILQGQIQNKTMESSDHGKVTLIEIH